MLICSSSHPDNLKDINISSFNWDDGSLTLAMCYSDRINTWWDPDKFNWKGASWALTKYCSKYFRIWWNPEKFDWNHAYILANYCNGYFDIWWRDDIFNMITSDVSVDLLICDLFKYCKKYTDKWLPVVLESCSLMKTVVLSVVLDNNIKTVLTKYLMTRKE